jgi:hypothetical protein
MIIQKYFIDFINKHKLQIEKIRKFNKKISSVLSHLLIRFLLIYKKKLIKSDKRILYIQVRSFQKHKRQDIYKCVIKSHTQEILIKVNLINL